MDKYSELVEKYKPRFFFDTIKDKNFPMDPIVYLELKKEGRLTENNVRGSSNHMNVYCHVLENPTLQPDYVIISYHFFCGNNKGYKIFGKWFGSHYADWEHVQLYFRKKEDGLEFERVFFSQHGNAEGEWVMVEDNSTLQFLGGHIRVFVAPNSHACYPDRDLYIRCVGLLNDNCYGCIVEIPSTLIRTENTSKTLTEYKGWWAPSSITSPWQRPYITETGLEFFHNASAFDHICCLCKLS